jgi:hypothetical protein
MRRYGYAGRWEKKKLNFGIGRMRVLLEENRLVLMILLELKLKAISLTYDR